MITLWKQLAPALCVPCHLFVVVKSTFLPFHSNLLDHSAVNWRVNTQRLLPASTVCFFFCFFFNMANHICSSGQEQDKEDEHK